MTKSARERLAPTRYVTGSRTLSKYFTAALKSVLHDNLPNANVIQ